MLKKSVKIEATNKRKISVIDMEKIAKNSFKYDKGAELQAAKNYLQINEITVILYVRPTSKFNIKKSLLRGNGQLN